MNDEAPHHDQILPNVSLVLTYNCSACLSPCNVRSQNKMRCMIYPAFVKIQLLVCEILHVIHVKMNDVAPPTGQSVYY